MYKFLGFSKNKDCLLMLIDGEVLIFRTIGINLNKLI